MEAFVLSCVFFMVQNKLICLRVKEGALVAGGATHQALSGWQPGNYLGERTGTQKQVFTR